MTKKSRFLSAALSVLMSVVVASSLSVGAAFASPRYSAGSIGATPKTVAVQAKKNGWDRMHTSYYRKGVKVTGLQKIGSKRYYFTASGKLKTKDVHVGGVSYYVNEKGVLIGAEVGGKYYYNTLKRMTKADSYDFETYLKARSIVKKTTNKNDSKATRLWKTFKWVVDKSYAIHQDFNPRQTNWTAIYARHHFDNRGGDCHADGAAFAYLAAAVGYKADVCIDSWGTGYAPSHCWAMIGNAVYDPLFYESKSSMYFGATSGTYETSPTARFRVPQYNPKNAKSSAKVSSKLLKAGRAGLQKVGNYYYYYQNGKVLKNKWKTVNGKRYYFKGNGRAATMSTKIKGAYYLFNAKGVLQSSTQSGTRLVTIGSDVYRVNKKGKAVSGWSDDKTKRFDETGMLLTGVRWVNGAFHAADASGVYNANLTTQLNAYSKRGSSATALRTLLGKPKQESYSASCNIAGKDGLWVYDHFMVTTALPADTTVSEYVWSIEAR